MSDVREHDVMLTKVVTKKGRCESGKCTKMPEGEGLLSEEGRVRLGVRMLHKQMNERRVTNPKSKSWCENVRGRMAWGEKVTNTTE